MEPSALHSQVAAFEEEDNCLYFALGLAHASSQVMSWLEAESDQGFRRASSFPQAAGLHDPQAEALTDFLLGLISFLQHYDQSLAINLPDLPQDIPAAPSAVATPQTRLVIRDLLV